MAQTIATDQHTYSTQQQEKIDPKLLGETYAFWCQTLVLFAAVVAAVWAILAARRIERRKAAAGVIFTSRKDDLLAKALRHITTLHNDEKNMPSFARKENLDSESSKSIRYALNHYEYVSVGIAQGIYDEDIFKHSSYTTVTRLYTRTKTYIEEVRKVEGIKTIYQEFECLACRWIDNPLDPKTVRTVPAKRWRWNRR
jgi:hypothetical protein